jgi:hypothetical protein
VLISPGDEGQAPKMLVTLEGGVTACAYRSDTPAIPPPPPAPQAVPEAEGQGQPAAATDQNVVPEGGDVEITDQRTEPAPSLEDPVLSIQVRNSMHAFLAL